MAETARVEIFTDGACPFCRAIQERVASLDTRHRLRFLDYNDPAVAARAPFPRTRLDEEMHVRATDGTWHAGYAGWVVVLRELPQYAWLGWLLAAPPFRWFGPGLYRWIARHRYRIPGFPAPCHSDTCAISAGAPANHSSIIPPETK